MEASVTRAHLPKWPQLALLVAALLATIATPATRATEPVNDTTGASSTSGQSLKQKPEAKKQQISQYKLPSWFSYELYKRTYGKLRSKGQSNELHKRIYLRRALQVLESRANYRAARVQSLASINELSDLTSEELNSSGSSKSGAATETGASSNGISAELESECCTYDQVYQRIIGMLNVSSTNSDWTLSRAIIDELQLNCHLRVQQRPMDSSKERSEFSSGWSRQNEGVTKSGELSEKPKGVWTTVAPEKAFVHSRLSQEHAKRMAAKMKKQLEDDLNADTEARRAQTAAMSALFGKPVVLRTIVS